MNWARDRTLARIAMELVVASFIVLFQELALIRWLAGQVRVLAYFPNLVLLSAFLGLGIGCLSARRRSLLWLWPVSLVVLAGAAYGLGHVIFTQRSTSLHLWLLYFDLPRGSPVIRNVQLPILIFFVLGTLSFIPLGQIVAQRLQEFKARSNPLWGYCWDLVGSLIGVVAFSAAGFSGIFPVYWFAVALAAGALFFRAGGRSLAAYGALVVLTLGIVARAERAQVYSPYYAITRHGMDEGFIIVVNGSLHQNALGLRASAKAVSKHQEVTREGYHVPYRLLGRRPRHALVLGAGSGNDVAVLLDEGAESVDAVEIDPVILELGRRFHPDRPYSDPRVHAYNTDARSFLNTTDRKYDMIVFGTLDSMTQLSALANVRLDNFVYTLDCMKAARDRLTDDGGLALYFMAATDYIDMKLFGALALAFDAVPLVHSKDHDMFNRIYMEGPAFAGHKAALRQAEKAEFLREYMPTLDVPTDDWPFLYVFRRGISGFYLGLMAFIALLAGLAVALVSPQMRSSLASLRQVDWEMLLFGLAFLLLETRAVTQMSLAWGATWITSAVVFGSILLMVLLATGVAGVRPMPLRAAFVGLAASLFAIYLVPTHLMLQMDLPAKILISGLYVGVPIFFAATCFALLFEERPASDIAFGWNLLGAVAGGLLEFLSMSIGLRALLLVALLAYLSAALIRLRTRGEEAF